MIPASLEDLKNRQGTGDKTQAKALYVYEKLKELYGKLSPSMQVSLKEQVINKNITKKLENYFESESRLISEETLEAIEDAVGSGEITIEKLDR